ncbi:MAG TPA: A/G-specific adenine glycosylase [Gemmatimonadetes bacterium]|jgi:A/G-specific adenine glycosylase|nr:A/G-specific adenine glycosylase [Gemmatimonadota bacterium]
MARIPDQKITQDLLRDYYEARGRDLPWRENRDPYKVWVSEIMLQQTRVETVIPYFNTWIERFPKLSDLADADEESILHLWQGLGYYSRARNLLKAIQIVDEHMGGSVPRDPMKLRTLPGIGEYTANAIASIAFGEPLAAIDGNLRRVLSRLFDLPDPSSADLKSKATLLLDIERPGDWNQAVMDLGATVCTPRTPDCGECPLENQCQSAKKGTQVQRPISKPKLRTRSVIQTVVIAVNSEGEFLLRKRPTEGLLAGLWEFPGTELTGNNVETSPHEDVAKNLGIDLTGDKTELIPLNSLVDKLSHLTVTYQPLLVIGFDSISHCVTPDRGYCWAGGDAVKNLPLPVGQQKLLKLAREALDAKNIQYRPSVSMSG